MDYFVRSVPDLISSSTTPNKPKVMKKQFKMKSKNPSNKENEIISPDRKLMKKLNKTGSVSPKGKRVKPTDDLGDLSDETVSTENEEPRKILKRKRSTSPKIKHFKPTHTLDTLNVTQSDTDDSEVSDDNSNKRKIPKTNETEPKNPDHTTIFVGNLPLPITHQKLEKLFSNFGSVVNARIRSVPVADPTIPKKVAAIKKQFHPDRKSLHGYVTFATREDAQKALSLNGQQYKNHHIRVNICDEVQNPDKNKAIFLGNISFAAEEEELWKLFESCGEIESVRLVRDRITHIGKGFGYINFKSADSVELALQMGEVKLRDQVLRISLHNGKTPKKEKKEKSFKKFNLKKFDNQRKESKLITTATNGQFQGKFATEKKKKFCKGNQQKKQLTRKIAPKTISAS